MKRKHFALILLIVGCGFLLQSGCQDQAKPSAGPLSETGEPGQGIKAAPQSDKPSPKITFQTLGCDFGEVGPNVDNFGEIKFTNTGDELLEITKLSPCCGVQIAIDKEKMKYEPGETGVIKVKWRSGSYPTTFTRQYVVHSNDPVNPGVTLTITAKVVDRIVCEPKRLRLVLDEENAGAQKITVRSLDDKVFSITDFTSSGDCITTDFDPSVEASKFVLDLKVDSQKLQKNLKGRITLGTSHPEGKSAVILFDVLPKYTLSPPLLIIFDAQPEKPTLRKISVLNNYKGDFEVESVTSKGNVIGVKMVEQRKINNGYQLDLELTPPAEQDKVRFTDTLYVNLKDGEKLLITCNGWYSGRKTKPETGE